MKAEPGVRNLAAGDAHVPIDRRRLRPPVDDEVVTPRLARDGLDDRGVEQRVVSRCPERCAQVRVIFLAQAHIELAGARHPHAIAAFAEIVRQRRDEAETAARSLTVT